MPGIIAIAKTPIRYSLKLSKEIKKTVSLASCFSFDIAQASNLFINSGKTSPLFNSIINELKTIKNKKENNRIEIPLLSNFVKFILYFLFFLIAKYGRKKKSKEREFPISIYVLFKLETSISTGESTKADIKSIVKIGIARRRININSFMSLFIIDFLYIIIY